MADETLAVYMPTSAQCVLAEHEDDFIHRMKQAVVRSSNCHNVDHAEAADMIVINQTWKSRNWHDLVEIESCSFISEHSERILVVSHDDVATTFFPGLYASLTRNNVEPGWAEPAGYKRQYRALAESEVSAQNFGYGPLLFSFRGNDFSHPVRTRLSEVLKGKDGHFRYTIVNKKFHSHTAQDYVSYVKEILASLFVLAPRGYSPNSYRIYEAMQYGRCPVIISDDWQPIHGIDWSSCSIRVQERDIGQIVELLNRRRDDAEKLGANARTVWLRNFADNARESRMLADLVKIHHSHLRSRNWTDLKCFWRSNAFKRAHGWQLRQRAMRHFEHWVQN